MKDTDDSHLALQTPISDSPTHARRMLRTWPASEWNSSFAASSAPNPCATSGSRSVGGPDVLAARYLPDGHFTSAQDGPGTPTRSARHGSGHRQRPSPRPRARERSRARHDHLDDAGSEAMISTALAIESNWQRADAGVWKVGERRWTHSELMCAAGLRTKWAWRRSVGSNATARRAGPRDLSPKRWTSVSATSGALYLRRSCMP